MSIYGSTPPPPMSTPGSRARAIGLTITLLSVSGGIHFSSTCGFGLLLSFTGILAGANLVAFGVSKADDNPAPTFPTAFDSARALAAFMRRSTATAGLVMASCAVTAVSSGEADPVLFFAMFALLLLGVSLVIAGARGECAAAGSEWVHPEGRASHWNRTAKTSATPPLCRYRW
ncbi:uncharacterized protein [Zea mays]|uniref:uncharacterized protein isoform X3 n=1 Tax=Zea mays TaxID=4577 RepID=UPI0009AAD662|nr:uncharacterized protein LOC100274932 isoform X3 [Zea mays]|eukprot:XP_020406982.1 uncharacterized protein LOC100274932 isoform X1 [Zea mays]